MLQVHVDYEMQGRTHLPNSSSQPNSSTLPCSQAALQSHSSSQPTISSTGRAMKLMSPTNKNKPFRQPRGKSGKEVIPNEPKARPNKAIWKP